MTEKDNEQVSVSARVPVRIFLAAVGAVLAGGLSMGAWLPEKTESKALEQCYDQANSAKQSADRAEAVVFSLVKSFEQASGDFGLRISRNESQIETLRADLLKWSLTCYATSDANEAERIDAQTHAQLQRAIETLERELDMLKSEQQRR